MQQLADITEAIVEPFTIEELKGWMRVTDSESDYIIESAGKSAREFAENYTGYSLVDHKFELYVETTEASEEIELPMPNIDVISKVESITIEGEKTEIELNSGYYLTGTGLKVAIFPTAGRYLITYTTKANLKEGLKAVVKDYASAIYDNRPTVEMQTIINRMNSYRRLMAW